MYGDEKHSAVLLNEIDGFRLRFDVLRAAIDGSRSRTVYGRAARMGPTRRQPRPQIFDDDDDDVDTPATIFRVVTETSIKVGDAITQSMSTSRESSSVSHEPVEEFHTMPTATSTTQTAITTTETETPTTTTETSTTTTTTESTVSTSEISKVKRLN